MPIIIAHPDDPGPKPTPGGKGSSGGSKGFLPGGSPGTNLTAFTAADQAVALPIVWGTVKCPALLIEKLPSIQVQPPAWIVGQFYGPDMFVAASGGAYVCASPGTAGTSAPSGQGTPAPNWPTTPGTALALGAVYANGQNVYRVTTAGNTHNAVGPTGFSADEVDDSNFTGAQPHYTYLGTSPYNILLDGTVQWHYAMQLPAPLFYHRFVVAFCEGEIVGALTVWYDKTQGPAFDRGSGLTDLGKGIVLQRGPDALTQALNANFDTSGYQRTAVACPLFSLSGAPGGTQAEIYAMAAEIQGVMFGVTTKDVNPADIFTEVLTHSRRGVEWPGFRVDASVGGSGAASLRTWCDAKGLRISYLLDAQRPAMDILSDLLNATNSAAFMSQGALKVVPLDDTAIPSPVFGAVGYVPPNVAQYNLTADDLLEPIQWTRRMDVDCFDSFPVEYVDRSLGAYSTNRVENPILSDARVRGGIQRGGTIQLPFVFPDGTFPVMHSRIAAQQSLRNRNAYTLKVGPRFIALEPCDIVTAPVGDSIGNFAQKPMRILQIDEDSEFNLTLTCEDYPAGIPASKPFTPQIGDGYDQNFAKTTAILPTKIDGVGISVQNGAIPAAAQTPKNSDNLIGNATSEDAAPAGADLTTPEWAGLFNAGAGAFAGSWVRQIVAASHTPVLIGDKQAAPFANQSQLGFLVRCAPGESFYIESQTKMVSATAGEQAGVYMQFLDGSLAVLGSASADTRVTAPAASWAKTTAIGTAPSGTVYCFFFLFSNCSLGASTVQWDAIYARRMADNKILNSYLPTLASAHCNILWDGTTLTINSPFTTGPITFTSVSFVTATEVMLLMSNAFGTDLRLVASVVNNTVSGASPNDWIAVNSGAAASLSSCNVTFSFVRASVLQTMNGAQTWTASIILNFHRSSGNPFP